MVMRHDINHYGYNGHLRRTRSLEHRLRAGETACVWGASSGNLAWEMLRIVGRQGQVWAQEPDPERTHEARDFFRLPNLEWCALPTPQIPPHNDIAVCVVDWVPAGGDHLVLERLESWPALTHVRSMMTEQHTPGICAWMARHGFQEAWDSRPYHAWWDRV